MKTKKVLGIVILSVAVLVSGCAEETITEEELVSRVVEAYQEIETVRVGMNITSEMKFQIGESTRIFEMAIVTSGALDNVNENMKANWDIRLLRMLDQSERICVYTNMYLIDNIMYSKTNVRIDGDFIAPAEWVKGPQNYHDIVDTENPSIQILKTSEIEFLLDGRINDVECYVVRLTPDVEKIWEITKDYIIWEITKDYIIKAQMDVFGVGIFAQDMIDFQDMRDLNLNQIFRDLDIIYWIAKDTFYPIKKHTDKTIVLDSKVLPDMPKNFEIEIDLEMTVINYDHNVPVTIKLPEEAKKALNL